MNGLCAPYDITPVQGMLLIVLEPGKGRSMNELSECMGCDASNITGLIERLEQNEFIKKNAAPNDRRVKVIMLSQKGESCRSRLLDDLVADSKLDLGKLTPEELDALARLLKKLVS